MKNFVIKNAMALVALAIATGSYTLMSFGLENSNVQQDPWFAVDANLQPTNELPTGPDPSCETLASPDCAKQYNEEDTEMTSEGRRVIPGQENNFINHVSLTTP